MTFPVVGSNQPLPFEISNSLRFNDGDTPYLTRSTGTTNKKTFTVSVWAKRSTTGARQTLWSSDNNTNDTGDGTKGGSGNYISFWNNGEFMFGGFGGSFQIRGDGLQRDIAGWYHIVAQTDTTQATTNDRGKLWINGVQQTTYTSMIGQNIDVKWATNRIGVRSDQANYSDPTFFTAYMDGYLAELHVIDGQALTASDFGEFDTGSGIWKPKQYEGTYGADGYYLKFSNSGNMGEDSSGNDNTFTPVNLSGTTDVTTDTPTNNFATLNPNWKSRLANDGTFSEGNTVRNFSTSTDRGYGFSTIGVTSGKWYWEVKVTDITRATYGVGYDSVASFTSPFYDNSPSNGFGHYASSTSLNYDNTSTAYATALSNNDIAMIALDMDNHLCWFGKNGTWFNSATQSEIENGTATNDATTAMGTQQNLNSGEPVFPFVADLSSTGASGFQVNFGNPSFSISSGNTDDNGYGNFEYAPPTGYLALCTQNLATALSPTIDDGSQYFNTVLKTGAGAGSYTGVGFQPDFLWFKRRDSSGPHFLIDSTRGSSKYLASESTAAETTDATFLTSIDSDGWTGGSGFYGSPATLATWNWKANGGTTSSNTDGSITSTVQANTTAGFSIVTYTGNGGTGATVGHGLGVAPKVVIVKPRNGTTAYGWRIYTEMTGNTKYLLLNATDPANTFGDWNNTSPTSSVFTVNSTSPQVVNESGTSYLAYCFAEIEGYSKFGSYTANGSTDGVFLYTGFRPAFLIVKITSTVGDWILIDNKRSDYNVTNKWLNPNQSSAEQTSSNNNCDFLSNGIKLRSNNGDFNFGSNTYIYMAFAENPFVTSGAVPVTAR